MDQQQLQQLLVDIRLQDWSGSMKEPLRRDSKLLMKGRRSGGVPGAVARPSNNPKKITKRKMAKYTVQKC